MAVEAAKQNAPKIALAVTIPFAFQAGDQTMPAGEYRVESVLTGTGQLQCLRHVNGSAVMIVSTMSVEARNRIPNPELVIEKEDRHSRQRSQ